MANTTYMIFERNGSGIRELGEVEAATPKAAMSLMADKIAKETGQPVESKFAACPVRNWTELPVGVEVVTRIKVG